MVDFKRHQNEAGIQDVQKEAVCRRVIYCGIASEEIRRVWEGVSPGGEDGRLKVYLPGIMTIPGWREKTGLG
jgi:hypothetical protein